MKEQRNRNVKSVFGGIGIAGNAVVCFDGANVQSSKMFLQGSTETVNDNDMSTSMFGLMESMILPENSELWAGTHMVTAADGVFAYNDMMLIKDSSTGEIVAYIDAPEARDSSIT